MGSALHAVSADGSTIFFTAPPTPKATTTNLYVRQNGSSTVQVDAGIGGGGQFQAASQMVRRCSSLTAPEASTSTTCPPPGRP